jgi:hypothetical protein
MDFSLRASQSKSAGMAEPFAESDGIDLKPDAVRLKNYDAANWTKVDLPIAPWAHQYRSLNNEGGR